jgi:hypothetical protein
MAKRVLLIAVLAVSLAACGESGVSDSTVAPKHTETPRPTVPQEPTPEPVTSVPATPAVCGSGGSLVEQVESARRVWNRQGIDSYRIVVSHVQGTWHYQSHTITVRDGQVEHQSATCVTAPMETALGKECEVEPFDPEEYTVPGLFATARSLAEQYPRQGVEIGFDGDYCFPSGIRFDLPDVVDEDQAWGVGSFEVLE